jgi:acyl carrier protein
LRKKKPPTMDRDEIKLTLKRLLIDGLRLETLKPEDVDDAAPIFVEGLGLDSVDALELVVLVEEKFNIQIPDEDVGRKAFASIDALADYVSGELARA